MTYAGRWYGDDVRFGLHYDFHAGKNDTDIGAHATPEELVPLLELMRPDYVQTDCKGHAGMTSWFSKVPTATVSPGVKKDALMGWRQATRQLGLPLHCHYSGVWDAAAGGKFPDWCRVKADGSLDREKMCVRGPYLDQLMVPQMKELIDRYEVDGFWVDGDIWAVEPCYCERCKKAFAAKTGIAEPPVEPAEASWNPWIVFTLESYQEYVTRYVDAVHAHKPGVLVCANWMQTMNNPGEPAAPTDFVSGDTPFAYGLDRCRLEARFISTRGKPWELMLWNFYKSGKDAWARESPWIVKPLDMLEQEASSVLAFGGNLQVYENPGALRDGRLADWRMRRLGELGRWVRARTDLCRNTSTIPQVAVLNSEAHFRKSLGKDVMWSGDGAPSRGATCAMLENHYGVDLMDEWALLPVLDDFPVVVAPEQDNMSDRMVEALKRYVTDGGRLLVTGAAAYERFGKDFLGVSGEAVEENAAYHVPALDGSVPLPGGRWRLVTGEGARALKPMYRTRLLDDGTLPYASATLNAVSKGAVAYIPCGVFRAFEGERSSLLRAFVGDVTRELAGRLDIEVSAPACVDVVLRQKDGVRLVHLINRAAGVPTTWNSAAVDEIPSVGPVEIMMRLPSPPAGVKLAFEEGRIEWEHEGGVLTARVPLVRIRAAVVVSP